MAEGATAASAEDEETSGIEETRNPDCATQALTSTLESEWRTTFQRSAGTLASYAAAKNNDADPTSGGAHPRKSSICTRHCTNNSSRFRTKSTLASTVKKPDSTL